jgi:hypothetical protein
MTVAVEYKPELVEDEASKTEEWKTNYHPQASSDVQLLEIENTGETEKWSLTINATAENIDRSFRIYFYDPRAVDAGDKKNMLTGEIGFNTGDKDLRNAVNNYFEGIWGWSGDVEVTSILTSYDINGNEVSSVEGNNDET